MEAEEVINLIQKEIDKNNSYEEDNSKINFYEEIAEEIKNLRECGKPKNHSYEEIFSAYLEAREFHNAMYKEIVNSKIFTKMQKIRHYKLGKIMDLLLKCNQNEISYSFSVAETPLSMNSIFSKNTLTENEKLLIQFLSKYKKHGEVQDIKNLDKFIKLVEDDESDRQTLGEFIYFYGYSQEVKVIYALDIGCKPEDIIQDDRVWVVVKNINNNIIDYINKLKRNNKNEKRNRLKLNQLYLERIKKINNAKEQDYLELTNDELNNYPIEIIKALNELFLIHNSKIIKNLNNKLEILNGNDKKKIKLSLSDNKLPQIDDNYIDELLRNLSYDEIQNKIILINKLALEYDSTLLFNLISNLTEKELNDILLLIDREIISRQYLNNNKYLLNSYYINKIIDNYNTYSKLINIKSLDELLTYDINNFEEIINLCTSYKLDINNKNIIKLAIQNKFFDGLDIWIEKDYYKYFMNNIDLIKDNFYDLTMRMVLAGELKHEIFNEDGTIKSYILDRDKFLVKQEEIEKYILNTTNLHIDSTPDETDELLRLSLSDDSMQQYYMDDIRYNVNGVVVSANKFKRNKSVFESNVEAVLFGSIYSEQECVAIINELNQRIFKLEK